jgi:hypothetical protein
MTMQKQDTKHGFFWHIHHKTLLEWSDDIDERIDYIKSDKPEEEVETRLRLMKPVQGELPKEVFESGKAYDEAWKALDEARKAWEEALQRNKGVIEELHRKECPNCPWDGKTIFPKKS